MTCFFGYTLHTARNTFFCALVYRCCVIVHPSVYVCALVVVNHCAWDLCEWILFSCFFSILFGLNSYTFRHDNFIVVNVMSKSYSQIETNIKIIHTFSLDRIKTISFLFVESLIFLTLSQVNKKYIFNDKNVYVNQFKSNNILLNAMIQLMSQLFDKNKIHFFRW